MKVSRLMLPNCTANRCVQLGNDYQLIDVSPICLRPFSQPYDVRGKTYQPMSVNIQMT